MKSLSTLVPDTTNITETRAIQASLWQQYRKPNADRSVENELILQYLPLVKTVVGRLAMTLPPHVDIEDLYSAGMVGLLNAVRQFDPKLGTVFEGYARLRIRGSVLDELRRMDWVPRSVHMKAREVEGVLRVLEQKKGRLPTDQEMAKAMNVSVDEYQQILEEIRPATFISLDAAVHHDVDDGTGQNETIADPRQDEPGDDVSRRELARLIGERLNTLPDMQRKVLALYYFEDLRLREIAEVFGLTESRICQIHAKAILAIRSSINRLDQRKLESMAA
ncbi:MAG: FliA/WhiG family RNA polymerase sigma factor [Verrucomicrobia bacterium]|nr:FliA/WhiG family RNA polymerase sigma factor [Verrucomicrobiota bacterium]MBI3871074.1 FliA/WhiG family RNA polymerase sigma factor [Verrucomicrobiota bacterium]